MDDLISRADALDALEREKVYCTARDGYTQINVFDKYNAGLTDGIKALKNLPSEQPKIIRCQECKHYEDGWVHCNRVTWWNGADDFCSRAERRTNE